MKKLKLFLLLFAAAVASAGLASCSSDDEDASSSIVGSWMRAGSNKESSEIMIFTADGVYIGQYTYNGSTDTETAAYTYDGTILTIFYEDGADQVTAVVSGDTMIFDGDEVFIRI